MSSYAFNFQGRTFTPDGQVKPVMTTDEIEAHNQALEAYELAMWAEKPQRFAGYITPNPQYDPGRLGTFVEPRFLLTSWRGRRLGRVTKTSIIHGSVGGHRTRVRQVWVTGTNGARYYGRLSEDWSQLVRLRRLKTAP